MFTDSPKRLAKEGDVLLSVRAPVGDINIAPHNCCIGRGLASLRSKVRFNSYIFYTLQSISNVFEISDDEGTIFGSINKDDLHNIEVVVPPVNEISSFDSIAKTIDKYYKYLDTELNILRHSQMLLLSKLATN